MRILFDECVPRKFKDSFSGHDSQTVPEAGFAGKKNGELLLLAESNEFEIFLTIDQGIEYQQNLTGRSLAILILSAKSNRLGDLLPLVDACTQRILTCKPGQVLRIEN